MEVSGFPQVAVAGIVFLAMIACFGTASAVLSHHWKNYEIDPKIRRRVRGIYYAGASVILVLMLVAFIFILLV